MEHVNAIISGQSGVALLMHAGELASLHAGRGVELVRRRPSEARFLLGDATDLQVLEGVALPEVSRRLELATAQMDTLHVALILLDGSLSEDTRQEAARELQELMEDEAVAVYVESLLFAHPLPGDSDLAGAFAACTAETEQTRSFLQKLKSLQGLIAEVHFAWEMIPAGVFGQEDRAFVRAQAAQEGLFRDLVLLRAADAPVKPFLANSLLRSKIQNKRDILTAWVAPLLEARPSFRPYDVSSAREDQFVAEGPPKDQT